MRIVISIFLLFFTLSCKQNKKQENKDVREQLEVQNDNQDENTLATINSLKSMNLSVLKDWSYNNRGGTIMKTWYKNLNNQIQYSCLFSTGDFNEQVLITEPQNFLDEQKIKLKVDGAITAMAYRNNDSITFAKLNMNAGQYETVGAIVKSSGHPLFDTSGVFFKLERIGKELDNLGVNEIHSIKGRMRFILQNEAMLINIQDTLNEEFVKKETDKCKMILPNWWLYVGK